jgi:hypothetical protein
MVSRTQGGMTSYTKPSAPSEVITSPLLYYQLPKDRRFPQTCTISLLVQNASSNLSNPTNGDRGHPQQAACPCHTGRVWQIRSKTSRSLRSQETTSNNHLSNWTKSQQRHSQSHRPSSQSTPFIQANSLMAVKTRGCVCLEEHAASSALSAGSTVSVSSRTTTKPTNYATTPLHPSLGSPVSRSS